MAKTDLTATRLRELLHYDPETGIFTRLAAVSNIPAGSSFGSAAKNLYLRGHLDGRLYYCHRLAVLYMTGKWPPIDSEHENGNRADNRWGNLRVANRSQNKQNISAATRSASGIRNVYFDKASGRWQVKIMLDYRSKSFGYYSTAQEAGAVAIQAKASIHTFQQAFNR